MLGLGAYQLPSEPRSSQKARGLDGPNLTRGHRRSPLDRHQLVWGVFVTNGCRNGGGFLPVSSTGHIPKIADSDRNETVVNTGPAAGPTSPGSPPRTGRTVPKHRPAESLPGEGRPTPKLIADEVARGFLLRRTEDNWGENIRVLH